MIFRTKQHFLTLTALLTALAIVIPLMMPVKLIIPPASYTLASHVPIFLAMFLSPLMTFFVIIGSTFGFLVAGYPFVVVLRALSHLGFGLLGAFYLRKFPNTLDSSRKMFGLNLVLALIHALCEVLVCLVFYTVTIFPQGNAFYLLFCLVGLGTFIHSIVDFYLAQLIFKVLKRTV